MPTGTIDPNRNFVADLVPDSNARWPTLTAAHAHAGELQRQLEATLRSFTSEDVDLVVFGSLARQEWTTGSDVDWTLLVDGQANHRHRTAAREVHRALSATKFKDVPLKKPGTEGTFGSIVFSHEIVHHIGGQADTNRNLTQRILLLLEGAALRPSGAESTGPFERTVRQVLNRYLESDSNFHSEADDTSRIPRFLLNDIVRFWRTMCVDFAYKDWEQAGRKWALRNIKLRMSRKVLFVAGLLTVFSCYRNDILNRRNVEGDYLLALQDHLGRYVHSTPLSIVAWTLPALGAGSKCLELLDCYERFLTIIDDRVRREHLEALGEKDVYSDSIFLECREISHQLQMILREICFEDENELKQFIAEYGVF